MSGCSGPYFVATTGWFSASRFDVNPNVGLTGKQFEMVIGRTEFQIPVTQFAKAEFGLGRFLAENRCP